MKFAVLVFSVALFFCYSAAIACSIQDGQDVQIGANKGTKGQCSNSGLPITCVYIEGGSLSCDGPSGSYSGYDLNSLVYSACGCSYEEEQKKQEEKELKQYQK